MLYGHGDDIHQYKDIRINFSSNVYGHPQHEGLFAHLAARLEGVANYPSPTPQTLEAELAQQLSLKAEEVMVTNGATEAIYLVAQTWRGSRSSILIPTFSEYADACRLHAHEVSMIRSVSQLPTAGPAAPCTLLWLCNPNNPTGQVWERDALLQTIRQRPDVLFIIDASYAIFTRKALLTASEAASLPNVLMLHSMTKEFAIPGLRLGYLTGSAALLDKVRTQRMPWSVNSLAQDAGSYLIRHRSHYQLPLSLLLAERASMAEAFAAMGIETYPSDTHILLCRLPHGTASSLKQTLAARHGILIRDASNFEGLDEACFRIAVQTPAENEALLEAMKKADI